MLSRGLNKSDGAGGKSAGDSSKLLAGKKESKKSKQQAIDTGVIDAKQKEDKEHNDSFEKYYNKDLDLDEGKYGWSGTASLRVCLRSMITRMLMITLLWVDF